MTVALNRNTIVDGADMKGDHFAAWRSTPSIMRSHIGLPTKGYPGAVRPNCGVAITHDVNYTTSQMKEKKDRGRPRLCPMQPSRAAVCIRLRRLSMKEWPMRDERQVSQIRLACRHTRPSGSVKETPAAKVGGRQPDQKEAKDAALGLVTTPAACGRGLLRAELSAC